ncbi:MAG: hypothetical protein WDW38_003991 [Sanguina aurantia]
MRSQLTICALLLACCFAVSHAGGGDGPDPTVTIPGVMDLTPENFDSIVNGGKAVLVEFYAPWCGHCKHLVPELAKLGQLIEADSSMKGRVVVAKVNADTHREIGSRFDVKGFPTLKFFGRGKAANLEGAADYNGGRTADAFFTYLKEQLEADKSFARVESLDEFAKVGLAALAPRVQFGFLKKAEALPYSSQCICIAPSSSTAKGVILMLDQGFSASEDMAAALQGMTDAASTLEEAADKSNAELYIKYATKAVEKAAGAARVTGKGPHTLTTEKARLDKILGSGSVAASKVEDFAKKSSILGHLTE